MKKTQTRPKNFWLIIALIAQAGAIGLHAYLTTIHYQLKLGNHAGDSLCNINQLLNCDAATASSFSSFLGTPLALWGALTNVLLLITILGAVFGSFDTRSKLYNFNFWLALFIAVVSVVMGTISITQLNSFCLFCALTWALSFLTFTCLALFLPAPRIKNLKEDLPLMWNFLFKPSMLFLFLLVPISVFSINFAVSKQLANDDIDEIVERVLSEWAQSPFQTFDIRDSLTDGASEEEAVLTIVEFSDFLCSHCKMAAPILHAFAQSRKDVRLVFQSFPLDGLCNEAVPHSGDGKRCFYAKAVFCANQKEYGWDVHDMIFSNFGNTKVSQIADFLASKGIDKSWFHQCLDSNQAQLAILHQAKQGEKAHVDGTPTIFVNGRKLRAGQYYQVLEAAYESVKNVD